MQRIIRKLDDLNAAELERDEVRTATIVRLPFHLCTGPFFHFFDPDEDWLEIWLRNKQSVPHGADIHEELRVYGMGTSPDAFLTDALLVNRQPDFRSSEFEAIKNNNVNAIGCASPNNPGFRLLNEVIAAHQMVRLGPYVAGLGAMWPRMLSAREMFQRVIGEVVLISRKGRALTDADVSSLFDYLDQLPLGLSRSSAGDIRDFSTEQLAELGTAAQKIRNHVFYELKTNAITAMLSGDSVVAIVLACAALEGVHGAFLRLVLSDRIPDNVKKPNSFVDTFLREQGFYSLVQLTSRVFMTDEERPTEDELAKCLNGVTIRNAIMHAGIKGTGKYKLRELSRSEIDAGYSGIMAVYRSFEAAFENRSE